MEEVLINSPSIGKLSVRSISAAEQEVTWDISSCLSEPLSEEESVKSTEFTFNNASFWLLINISKDRMAIFAIYFSRDRSSDKGFVTYCDISFRSLGDTIIKKLELILEDVDSNKKMNALGFTFELREVFKDSAAIICRMSKEKLNSFEVRSDTDFTSSIGSDARKSPVQTKFSENEDKELPIINPKSKMCQDFKKLLLSEEGSDVTIQVEDRQFKVHQLVLSARSSVFASMLRHEMKEKATGVVNVGDCEPLSFLVLLEYIYSGSTENLAAENVFNLYTSADKYDLKELKMKCLEFIQNNLSVDTFCETATLALTHSEASLLNLAVAFFAKNFKKIVLTIKWQAFISENPTQSNEIFIKAFKCDLQD